MYAAIMFTWMPWTWFSHTVMNVQTVYFPMHIYVIPVLFFCYHSGVYSRSSFTIKKLTFWHSIFMFWFPIWKMLCHQFIFSQHISCVIWRLCSLQLCLMSAVRQSSIIMITVERQRILAITKKKLSFLFFFFSV